MGSDLQAPRPAQSQSRQWTISRALYGLMVGAVRSQPRDMSLTSLSTLSTLEHTGPRRITDLAVREGVTQPSMTALVTGLARSDLVERRTDPRDGRVALVALTPKGTSFIQARRQAGIASFVQLIDELPTDEADALALATRALQHIQELDEDRGGRSHLSTPSRAVQPTT